MKSWICFIVMVALGGVSAPGWAEDAAVKPAEKDMVLKTKEVPKPSTTRRVVATTASVVPGVLMHGAGHFAVGDTSTGWKLLIAQGTGIALIAVGGATLALSGASDEINAPAIWVTSAGAGLFMSSWVADMYGVLTLGDALGAPVRLASVFDASLGYQYVRNPSLEGAHFSQTSLRGRWGRWSASGQAWFALDDSQWRARATGSWRLGGPRPNLKARDGSYADLWLGYVHHRYGDFGVTEALAEVGMRGRYDLVRVAPTLRGMFLQGAFGVAYGSARYDDIANEFTDMLLSELEVGWYLGHDRDGWSELSLFYDHRHDGFAAGTKMTGLGSGAIGSFGARLNLGLWRSWGISMLAEAGASYVVNANLVYRVGGSR